MGQEFAFVVGDVGAANAAVPVMKRLLERGNVVVGIADSKGIAADALAKAGTPTFQAASFQEVSQHVSVGALLVIGTSASVTGLERECATQGRLWTVMMSDGYFNHANPVWRDLAARWWLALDEGHAAAIRSAHPNVDQVLVGGQPAFDDAIELAPRKHLIRAQVRQSLGLADGTPFVVWWATGMAQVAQEDLQMVLGVLGIHQRPLSVAFRMHPKLDKTVGPGYIDRTLADLWSAASTAAVSWKDTAKVPGIELCLAADVLVSITCTEDIKSSLIGGPPVVHFLGPKTRAWMEQDLYLKPPHYLPDVAAGLALAAYDRKDVAMCVERALDPSVQEVLREAWNPPSTTATERTADILERLTR